MRLESRADFAISKVQIVYSAHCTHTHIIAIDFVINLNANMFRIGRLFIKWTVDLCMRLVYLILFWIQRDQFNSILFGQLLV